MTKQKLFEKAANHRNCVSSLGNDYIAIRNMRTGISVRFYDAGGQIRDDIPDDLSLSLTIPQAARQLGIR